MCAITDSQDHRHPSLTSAVSSISLVILSTVMMNQTCDTSRATDPSCHTITKAIYSVVMLAPYILYG